MSKILPVILAGGAGTRLWPASRDEHPKPFLPLPDGSTLLQRTLERVMHPAMLATPLIVTNQRYYFKALDLLPKSQKQAHFLLEPCGRNTAPAIAMAALHAQACFGEDTILLVLPADHWIEQLDTFQDTVLKAASLAEQGHLVTFGVQPSRPETGYGYIAAGEPIAYAGGRQVARFVEKPSLETAEALLAQGGHFWNAGIFCFSAHTLLQEMSTHAPAIYQQALYCHNKIESVSEQVKRLEEASFAAFDDISIDYALFEHSRKVAMMPAAFDWNDIGSWSAYADLLPADQHGNQSNCAPLWHDASNCMVLGDGRLVAMVGVDNLVVIDTDDAILISDKSRTQDVKHIVKELKARDHEAYRLHRTVHRPWGTYTVLEEGPGFKIKRIVVKPGRTLSLQMHHHRSEHWIVDSGMAKVTVDGVESFVNTNESTYIPAGHQHRLENSGILDLVLIEVQSGPYLGEDDIVRFEDKYGRA